MKWLVYLFSFYILLLSGIPCMAEGDCCVDEISTTTPSGQHDDDTKHTPVCPCSPFFACGTCYGVVVPIISVEFPKILPPVAKLYYLYDERLLFDFSAAIWQPPQTV